MFPPSPSNCYPGPVPGPVQRQQTRPKRLKAHTVISKLHNIPMVPRDKNNKPMLPLNVGIMTVISLGTVCMREHFHTERYIFPVGYEVSRRYLSTLDPNIEVVYHCTILDGGDGPKFQIIPSDVPEHPVMAGTASGAWASIVKQANAIRNRQHSNSVSGPDFFGLGQNTIKHLIQELPNSNKLRDYVWQQFVEGGQLGGRHAAVIPALPEDYDAVHPVRPYYPAEPKQNRPLPESPRSHYPPHVVAQQTSSSSMAPPQRHPSDQFMQRQSSEDMYLEQYDTGYDRNSYLDESSHHVPPTFASIMHAHASYHPSDPLA
ncbi:F/Y-rich N-terminus-domain-containing protein [Mycena floridula]|nr:F/Y-rich N-terminus-domain-containing protein [Mycena floridula]